MEADEVEAEAEDDEAEGGEAGAEL